MYILSYLLCHQRRFTVNLYVPKSDQYVLILTYLNPTNRSQHLDANVASLSGTDKAKLTLHSCQYRFVGASAYFIYLLPLLCQLSMVITEIDVNIGGTSHVRMQVIRVKISVCLIRPLPFVFVFFFQFTQHFGIVSAHYVVKCSRLKITWQLFLTSPQAMSPSPLWAQRMQILAL